MTKEAAVAAVAKKGEEKKAEAKPAVALEDDDEFEDFPTEPWKDAATELGSLPQWDDAWEDEDQSEDFASQLKAEEKKRAVGVAPMKM
ncbi:hypothetical protein BC831DRAFT_477151 [Entophlyctis helioformis]|nr:hypothetical protein BC831DRAFT_477151 [Entophlyctis helioformis]